MTSKIVLAFLASAVLMAGTTAAQGTSPIAGTWNVHMDFQNGRTFDEDWVMTENGGKVTGKVVLRNGREVPIEGSLDGNSKDGHTLNIKVTTRPAGGEGGERFHYFIGVLAGDTIKGTLERGDNTDEATFTAKRR
jgi:hypothetical protein